MNNMLCRSLSFALIVIFPTAAFAQQDISAPPIFVRPSTVRASEVVASPILVLPRHVLDKQRQNQSDEGAVKQLIRENTQLAEAVQEKQKKMTNDIELFADYAQFNKLRAVLNSYLEQIEARDRLLAQREAQIADLQTRLEKTKEDQDQNQGSLSAQYKLLEEKSRQLTNFKEELSKTREELIKANDRYDAVIKEYEAKIKTVRDTTVQDQDKSVELTRQLQGKAREAAELGHNLNTQNAKLEELENALKVKDDQLAKSDGSVAAQDKEIAELKQQLDKGRQEADNVRAELAKDDDAFAQIREKGLGLKNKLKEQSAALASREEFITEFKAQLVGARDKIDAQALKLAQAGKEAQSQQARAGSLQRDLDSRNKDLTAAEQRLKLWEEIAGKRRQRIALLEEKGRLLMLQIGSYQQRSDTYADKLSRTAASWSNQKSEYEARILSLERSIKDYQEKVEELNRDIAYKKAEQESLRHLLDGFTNRIKETSDVTQAQSRTIASYRTKIDQLDQDLRKATDDVHDKEASIEGMRRNLEQVKQTVKELQQELQAKDLSLGMVQTMIGEKKDELAQAREKLTVAEAKLKQADKREELLAVQDMLKASREETIQLNYLLAKKESQIKDLQKGLDINSKEFTRQNKALEEIKAGVEEQQTAMAKLKEDMQWKGKEIERLKMQLKQQRGGGPLAPTKEKLKRSSVGRDPAQLRQDLKDAKEQIATLKEKLKQKCQSKAGGAL